MVGMSIRVNLIRPVRLISSEMQAWFLQVKLKLLFINSYRCEKLYGTKGRIQREMFKKGIQIVSAVRMQLDHTHILHHQP